MSANPAEAVKGKLRILILHLLSEREMNGYEIRKRLGGLLGRSPSAGTVYPLLRSLLRRGLIECRVEGTGRRTAKTYRLTEKGRRLLEEQRGELEEALRMVEALRLAKELGLSSLAYGLWRLIKLLPRLGEEQRRLVAGFAREEAERLEELLRRLGEP